MKSVRLRGAVVGVALAFLFASPAFGGEHNYVGTRKCKGCHLKEWKSWSETKMAKAFEVLKPGERADQKKAAGLDPRKDYTKDAECLPCHVTGFGMEGGFVDSDTTPELSGVGCEMCHGAGGDYTSEGHMTLKNKEYKKSALVKAGLVGDITGEQCMQCHNTKSPFVGEDYVFDFETRKNEGTHEKYPLKYQH